MAPYRWRKAHAYCRRLARSHYENFSVASLLLPKQLRPHFHAVYAYCRWADDLGDETGGGQRTWICCAGGAANYSVVTVAGRIIR